MNSIFVDAGFWIALRDRADLEHSAATAMARVLLERRVRLVTTALVFAEIYARFSRNRLVREQFIRDIWENPVVRVEPVVQEDEVSALRILRQHSDKSFSFSDAVSFALMMRLGLQRAISFDKHFRQFGKFEIVERVTDV